MPDGVTHLKIWGKGVLGSLVASAIIWFGTKDPVLAAGFMGGYLSGRYLSPDLDLIGLTSDEGRMMQELKIFGVLLVMWFLPYAYFMRFVGIGRKGHRNFFSHFPIVSTAIRLLWLFMPVALAIEILIPDWRFHVDPRSLVVPAFSVLLGLGLADTYHFIADTTTERRKLPKWN